MISVILRHQGDAHCTQNSYFGGFSMMSGLISPVFKIVQKSPISKLFTCLFITFLEIDVLYLTECGLPPSGTDREAQHNHAPGRGPFLAHDEHVRRCGVDIK